MAERTIATVLKTVEVQASGGSNPPPSAALGSAAASPGSLVLSSLMQRQLDRSVHFPSRCSKPVASGPLREHLGQLPLLTADRISENGGLRRHAEVRLP